MGSTEGGARRSTTALFSPRGPARAHLLVISAGIIFGSMQRDIAKSLNRSARRFA